MTSSPQSWAAEGRAVPRPEGEHVFRCNAAPSAPQTFLRTCLCACDSPYSRPDRCLRHQRTLRHRMWSDVRWWRRRRGDARWPWSVCGTLILLVLFSGYASGLEMQEKSIDEEAERFPDFRFISYRQLLQEGKSFADGHLEGYTQMVLDESRQQLLVGGQDALFRLSLQDLAVLEQTDWQSPTEVMQSCITSGQSEGICHNFVKVLLLHGEDRVFACGTNAFSPVCTWRYANNLTEVERTISGKAICPFSPLHNTTALMTATGELYTATVIDKLARDPSIIRNLGSALSLRTEQMNSKWLNEPNFVSTYEFGNFVYFFFREIAVEYINCGKKVYSRAARVCKTDRGGTILLEGKWTTFHKARLNCSLPGVFPFYFDELQSTFYSQDEQLVYAIFSTPPNSLAGSAVCAYNMTSFEAAFGGPFKHQKDPMSAWMKHENGHAETRKCVSESGGQKRSSEKSADHLVMAQKYQLMDQAVQPTDIGPIIMREQERWTHLVVDHVATKQGSLDVFFLATDDGKVQKMMRLPATPTSPSVTCLVEDIKIVPNGKPRPVKAMVLSAATEQGAGAVYLSTNGNILKVPLQRCSRFKERSACLGTRDPYCGWNTIVEQCTPPPSGDPFHKDWEQDLSSCPSLDMREDGRWSDWSDWSKCPHVGGDAMLDHCLCRSRSCDNPKPSNGGNLCQGQAIEIVNCTVHGQWTDWSEWSACSKTCGLSFRERKRQCGNPQPRNGGRQCQGVSSEEQVCSDQPACPLPPVDGRWSDWSGWSACTKDCNGGIQTRRRFCNQPPPSRGGQLCDGNKQEYRMCNTQDCPEVARISPWTEWVQTNRTAGGYFEQRFRFTCRAAVPQRKLIKTSFAKSQARFCHNNGSGCQTADTEEEAAQNVTNMDGGWSPWSRWAACTVRCQGGVQWRNRTCDSPEPSGPLASDCDGQAKETRACNTQSCLGSWSCWSPYSTCSVTCGAGVRSRTRVCQRSQSGLGCLGVAEDTESCQTEGCVTVAPSSASLLPTAASSSATTAAASTTTQTAAAAATTTTAAVTTTIIVTPTTTAAAVTPTTAAVPTSATNTTMAPVATLKTSATEILSNSIENQDNCSAVAWSEWTECRRDSSMETGVQYRHRHNMHAGPEPHCQGQVEIRACPVNLNHVVTHEGLKVAAILSSNSEQQSSVSLQKQILNAYNSESARELSAAYLIVTSLVSFVIGGAASVGLYIYIRHYRKQRRQEEALWSTSFSQASDIFAVNGPFTENDSTLASAPKMNNLSISQGSLEMRVVNNLNEMSYSDALGSLRKGKITVNEAETLKRNSMWTNLSMNDEKY